MGKQPLKVWRATKNMTQAELADALGVARITVNNWETGNTKPNYSHLAKMANLFECDIGDFLLPLELAKSE